MENNPFKDLAAAEFIAGQQAEGKTERQFQEQSIITVAQEMLIHLSSFEIIAKGSFAKVNHICVSNIITRHKARISTTIHNQSDRLGLPFI